MIVLQSMSFCSMARTEYKMQIIRWCGFMNEVHSNISNSCLLMKMVLQTERVTRNQVAFLNIFITLTLRIPSLVIITIFLIKIDKFTTHGFENELGDDEDKFHDCKFNPRFTQQGKINSSE